MKYLTRFFILFLCCALLVFVAYRPVQVNATAGVASITVGVAGATGVVLSPYVLVGLLIGSFVGIIGLSIFTEAEDWYNEDRVIREWADTNAPLVSPGVNINVNVPIPISVHTAIYSRYILFNPVEFSSLHIPYDLSKLDNITSVDLLGVDVRNPAISGATDLTVTNTLISSLDSTLYDVSLAINDMYTGLNSRLVTLNSELIKWSEAINTTTAQFGRDIATWSSNLNSTISTWSRSIAQGLSDVNSTVSSWARTLNNSIAGVNANLRQVVIDIQDSIVTGFDNVITQIGLANPAITVPNTPALDDVIGSINGIENSLLDPTDGKNKVGLIVDSGNDILEKYLSAILAIFSILTAFMSVSVVGDLLQFSLALGIFALLVNIVSSIDSSSDSKSKSKSKSNSRSKSNSKSEVKGG